MIDQQELIFYYRSIRSTFAGNVKNVTSNVLQKNGKDISHLLDKTIGDKGF